MKPLVKHSKKDFTPEDLVHWNEYVERVRKGEVVPFKEKTERAEKNLRKAGLIK